MHTLFVFSFVFWVFFSHPKVVVPVPSLDEENEEQPCDEDVDGGNSSDEELVLSPLLSPINTTNQSPGTTPPLLPPLFLRLWYCLQQTPTTSGEEVQEGGRDRTESLSGESQKVGSGKPPLCFRK